ncbi:HIT family protein [Paracidovorax cattleyae]|uniref:Diadenosine tetraphosphate (Ap4A) hydrolase n=1 Tax=Paracidovorax cattleyae TaxID=80868 RepID=A0A1H0L9W0_9BURK|nr:HIT family protein [Paracidovorax cattleyae]AVS75305.1 HIT family protein [Paracidovorax cattleyae]SDO64997.1 Diadenosine tetraphosphate (Ap4A) hydrolase [Paracidovorax cattleyae]
MASTCPLCGGDGGTLVWRGRQVRVVHAGEEVGRGFPGFYRVIWNAHAAEFSDLAETERAHCMAAVAVVEQVLREQLQPAKINLAALGNMVPHLHWHVIARFGWDSHFPAPVWAPPQRERDRVQEAAAQARGESIAQRLHERLAQAGLD